MIYLKLFFTFLKIGAFSFGGGYAMIPVIREQCLRHNWLTQSEIMNFIAVSESTPGPIAINMATFVGSSQGGILGSLFATLGVVLPSFVIILVIATVMNNLMKYKATESVLGGIKPVITALICATGLTMIISVLSGIESIRSSFSPDFKSIIIFLIVVGASSIYKRFCKKAISPIMLIILSAALGILFFS